MPMKNTLCTALISSMLICSTASLQAKELAYVTNEKSNSLSVIDLDDYTVIKEVPVGERPRGFIFNHDQTLAYICASDSDRIQIFDVASDMIIGVLPSGEDPETIALILLHKPSRHKLM
jgi:YVTN family beta-propeller protein